VPSPQSLVTFTTTLFVLLLATHVQLGLRALPSAAISIVLALALAWFVERRIPDEDEDEDEITQEAEAETAGPE
jgi:MFS superfamily sulfate permease-like transporter